jgi:hypothetical protein
LRNTKEFSIHHGEEASNIANAAYGLLLQLICGENDKFIKKGGFYKMQNLQKTLIEILKNDPTYFSEEKLLKNKLTEDALKLEEYIK